MVTIEYECETDFDLGLDCPALAKMVAEKVLDMEKCPWDAQVNLVLTDNETIHKTNLEYRQIDRATDVLSFPMIEYEEPGDFSVIDEESAEAFNPESGELMLGDIVISKEKVLSQAEEYGHSFERELSYMIVHGFYHLMGYDHIEEKDKIIMRPKEEKILNELKITRD